MPKLKLSLPSECGISAIAKALRRIVERFRRREKLSCSEWADKKRVLKEPAAYPGRWRTTLTPYLKEPMDVFTDPDTREVWFMSASQMGKSEVLLNWIGCMIDQDPSSMLLIQPTVEDARSFSKKRVMPLLRDSLGHIFGKMKTRTSGIEILEKDFPAGFLMMRGANSESGISSTPIKYFFGDELKTWPKSAGRGGDPLDLGNARMRSYEKRGAKKGFVSSPGVADECRMEQGHATGDQRVLFVPCPDCGKFQVLTFKQIKWTKVPLKSGGMKHLPDTAYYECEHCKAQWDEADRESAVALCKWRPTNPDAFPGVVSFRLPLWYSLFTTMSVMVSEFLNAKKELKKGNNKPYIVWVNTQAAETYEDKGETVDEHDLIKRCEDFPASPLPSDVAVLTAGVDVQKNRLECTVIGWGRDEESWVLSHRILHGSPERPEVWKQLFKALKLPFKHPSGVTLYVSSVFVDSGYATKSVYLYVRAAQSFGIFAAKGDGGEWRAPLNNPKTPNQQGILLWMIGVDSFKSLLYRRLTFEEPSPGYIHFSRRLKDEYFKQLTCEERKLKFKNGRPVHYWVKPKGASNEGLDCMIYAMAALLRLGIGDALNQYVDELQGLGLALDRGDSNSQQVISGGIDIYGKGNHG